MSCEHGRVSGLKPLAGFAERRPPSAKSPATRRSPAQFRSDRFPGPTKGRAPSLGAATDRGRARVHHRWPPAALAVVHAPFPIGLHRRVRPKPTNGLHGLARTIAPTPMRRQGECAARRYT
jgi:hypothetical protein